uniref:Troponin T, skeletal muscle (inferred by orthology to a D. melanogaster protein) n=1 Tax=Strongyloides venezuelensis TaxID=75913 RepID=A0A0K0FE05_STRVS
MHFKGSEEEEYEEEEVEEEEEEAEDVEPEKVEEAEHDHEDEEAKTSQKVRKNLKDYEIDDANMTEGEKAMLAAKRRQEEEDKAKVQEYEEKRRIEREREEEELRKLKEKQERRRLEREAEEREAAEKLRLAEERRKQEEEERRARMEAEKKKKEEEAKRRTQMMGGSFASATAGTGGRNFVIPEKKEKTADKFGNIVQAKQEMGMTKEQQEEAKRNYMSTIVKGLDLSNVLSSDLKEKIKTLHQRICKLEIEKYDLEKRHERQVYDLKELNERQRQVARNTALKKGVDPSDAGGRHPPKVCISSKYDRQTDRRSFKEKRAMFDNKFAYPCFPNIPPPPTILEKKIKPDIGEEGKEGHEGEYDEYEEEYEEEEE